jgi:serine/threonine-protein kinase
MLTPGTLIDGRYEVISLLASGGMGQVYKARRVRLGDEVAIKVMLPSPDAGETAERFLRESRACAQLRHPNIVGILDFSVDGEGRPYLVMELLSGPSLREEIALHGAIPAGRALPILEAVGSALQLAHERGITHRDLKPANIVAHRYESGERVYKVIDFGLVALASSRDDTRLTAPMVFLGTLAYAAPEQIRGEVVDPRTDVYALGVIAYEMLTGARPFEGGNQIDLMRRVLSDAPTSAAGAPVLPPDVQAVVFRAIAKERDARWPSVAQFLQALATALGKPLEAPAPDREHQGSGLLGRYELGPLVGRGRLGSHIYRGTHRALGVPVAIRVLRREDQPHWDAARARFLLEARTLQVPHPSLLQVRDYGEDERGVYLVTEFIEGQSLSAALEKERMPWLRASALVTQMLEAADALHRRGGFLVGVNPDMIRLTTDKGLDRIVMSTAGINSVQDVLATMREQELRGREASEHELPYVPPEVLMGRAPDARADIFTIGVLAYRMMTGELPFVAPSLPELLGRMLTGPPGLPDTLDAGMPAAGAAVILRALAHDPAMRFQTAEQMRRAIMDAGRG